MQRASRSRSLHSSHKNDTLIKTELKKFFTYCLCVELPAPRAIDGYGQICAKHGRIFVKNVALQVRPPTIHPFRDPNTHLCIRASFASSGAYVTVANSVLWLVPSLHLPGLGTSSALYRASGDTSLATFQRARVPLALRVSSCFHVQRTHSSVRLLLRLDSHTGAPCYRRLPLIISEAASSFES